jgi:hypothetical protein
VTTGEAAKHFLRYFGPGGMSSAIQLGAFCHGLSQTTGYDRDLVAHALNERFAVLGRNHPVAYSTAPAGDEL